MKLDPVNRAMRLVLFSTMLFVAAGCSRTPAAPSASSAATRGPDAAESESRQRRVEAGERPVEAIDRVLIISIDGLRPDLLLRAFMPRVRGLCSDGCYTFWAETTPEAYTLPCHISMLTGVPSEKHGVTWNNYIEESYPNVPTLFEVAKQAGYSTAMATGKMKFIVLTKPGTLDHYYLPSDEPVSDRDVAAQAERLLRDHRPQVLFVHLAGTDEAGHKYGWGSTEQLAAIEIADEAVGLILAVLADLKLTDSTLVIVTSDHGGAGNNHVMNDSRSHFVPWIASGPGVRRDFDLTLFSDCRIGIEDTFATACAFLGIDPGDECAGRPVLEVLEAYRPKPTFASPGGKSAAVPQISAQPNPVPADSTTTTITWDTGDAPMGEVYVSVNGADEKRFSGSRRQGSQKAGWIGKGKYEFRLYAGTEHKTVLASVTVTRSNSN